MKTFPTRSLKSLGAPLSDFDFTSEKDALLVGSTARQHYSHGDVTAMALVMSDKERNLGVNQEEFASTDLEIFIETLENFEDDLAAGAGTGNSDNFFEDDTNNFIDPGADDVFLPVPDFSEVEEDVIFNQTPEAQEADTLESAVSTGSAPLPEMQANEDQNRSLSNAIMTQSASGSSSANSTQPPTIAEVIQNDVNNFEKQYGNVAYVSPSDPSITENPKIETLSDGTKKETTYDEGSTSVKIASPSGKTETVIVDKEGVVARAVNGLNGDASVLQYHAVDRKTGEVDAQLTAFDSSNRFKVAIAEHQQTDLRLVDGHLWLFVMDAAGKVVKKYDCGAKGSGIGSDEIKDCLIDEEPVEPEPEPEPDSNE